MKINIHLRDELKDRQDNWEDFELPDLLSEASLLKVQMSDQGSEQELLQKVGDIVSNTVGDSPNT